MKTLASELNNYSHNLNFLKFICALLVIFSHAFPVTSGTYAMEPLRLLTSGQETFGGVAVFVFIFTSGLYVSKSIERQKKAGVYFKTRFLRIYPLFISIMLITVFIIGPITTILAVSDYFSNPDTYKYFSFLILIPNYYLPGVFVNNPFNTVNEPLWYLILEIICYVGLFLAFKWKLLKKIPMLIIFIIVVIVAVLMCIVKIDFLYINLHYIRPLLLFIVGMFFYTWRDKIKLSLPIALIFIAILVVLALIDQLHIGMIFLFPYIICVFAFSKKQLPLALSKLGNYSYAIYLIAFPIQQTIKQFYPACDAYMNTLLSIVFSIIIAFLLYTFVEKKMSAILHKKTSVL